MEFRNASGYYTFFYEPQILLYTIKLCQKLLWRNLASVNLKLKKVKLFTQSLTKFYRINVFNVGGCLASLLNF